MISADKKTKVFIFTSVHPWNDVRIFYKQAISLSKKYKVELHAPAKFHKKTVKNITIYGLPIWKRKSERIRTLWLLFKRIWLSDATIFHFHDPELILHGILLKLGRRKKIIFDMHENQRKLIQDRIWIPVLLKIPLSIFFKLLEILSMQLFDKIILAEESYKKVIPYNSVIIRNYPIMKSKQPNKQKETDVIYVGGVLNERGADQLLRITNHIVKELPNFTMKIVGPVTSQYLLHLTKYIQQNRLENNITFTNRIDYNSAMDIIKESKIGIALLHPFDNYKESVPTKLFEYMQYGLPFLASDFPYWKQFFNKEDVGYFIPYDDTQLASNLIIRLLKNSELLKKMGQNGAELITKNYSWESEENTLHSLYNNVIK